MVKTLIKSSKYNGKYVALKDFNDNRIVGFGKTSQEAYKKAFKKGYKSPVIVFVPLKDTVQIYPVRQ